MSQPQEQLLYLAIGIVFGLMMRQHYKMWRDDFYRRKLAKKPKSKRRVSPDCNELLNLEKQLQ